jgi:SAM-dependent methyltransferase
MAEPAVAQRASSFGSVADAYDRFRPGPPISAVEWVLSSTGGTAADIGAGTGALTRVLGELVDDVIAIEPDARMLAVLNRRSPHIPAVRSWAEQLPIRSGALDAVTISSAWHWMDPDRTIAEIGRVIRPGGVLGVIWNGADRSVDWVTELLGSRDPSPGDRDRQSRHRFTLPSDAPFDELEGTVITWSRHMTQEQLTGLAGTYSATITMSPDQREGDSARVSEAAESIVNDGAVEVPMGCRCWRAVRR